VGYVVSAKWRAKAGSAERLLEVIEAMTPPSRAEPGNLVYQAHRSPDDPQLFWLYERYVDEAAYEAHMQSEHFVRLVKEEAIPKLLKDRSREFYVTVDDPD
jgi:quinol monooxygenase YgiN